MEPLSYGSIDRAAEVCARAFFHDPLFVFFFTREKNRLQKIQAMYRFLFSCCLSRCWMSSPLIEGVALWERAYDHGADGAVRFVFGGVGLVFSLGLSSVVKMARFFVWAQGVKSAFFRDEMFYLWMIAVDPPCQGGGVGKAMLQSLLMEADKHNGEVLLETQNIANVALYERFGFRVVWEGRFGDMAHVIMVRGAVGTVR